MIAPMLNDWCEMTPAAIREILNREERKVRRAINTGTDPKKVWDDYQARVFGSQWKNVEHIAAKAALEK
jgi:hypothetical protein